MRVSEYQRCRDLEAVIRSKEAEIYKLRVALYEGGKCPKCGGCVNDNWCDSHCVCSKIAEALA